MTGVTVWRGWEVIVYTHTHTHTNNVHHAVSRKYSYCKGLREFGGMRDQTRTGDDAVIITRLQYLRAAHTRQTFFFQLYATTLHLFSTLLCIYCFWGEIKGKKRVIFPSNASHTVHHVEGKYIIAYCLEKVGVRVQLLFFSYICNRREFSLLGIYASKNKLFYLIFFLSFRIL